MVKKVFLFFALNIFGIIFALVLFEVVFRFSIKNQSERKEWRDRPSFYYHHEAAPTMQEHRYITPKPANTYRIAVVGDSFSFATSMQYDDAYPARLERMLNLNDTNLKAEVINYAVPGYSTFHELESVRQAIADQADLVILQITLNDAQLKRYVPKGITGRNDYGEYQPSGSQKKLYEVWQSLGYVMARLHNSKTKRKYISYYRNLFKYSPAKKMFKASIKDMKKVCRKNETKFVAVVFPLFGLPLDDSYPFHEVHKLVNNFLKKINIRKLDLFETYKGAPLDRIQVVPGKDFHPNEIGHRMAAERIYTWMADFPFFPEELKIKERYRKRISIVPRYNKKIKD